MEFRSFLLFYSVQVLNGHLPKKFLDHWLLLVNAIFTLSSHSISPHALKTASTGLKMFCYKIREYYGARYETFNVHSLLHLAKKVEDLGPLWSHSCFYFESLNGDLRHLFHGTQHVESQVMNAVCVQQKIPELKLVRML